MKRFDTPTIRMALLVYIVAVTLIGLYSTGGPYLNSYMGRFFQTGSFGQNSRGSLHADHTRNSQAWGADSSDIMVYNLPDGWQINRSGDIFWLTHYNPNGSVADCLPFDSLENFYQWFETHPDCCDVDIDVEKVNVTH
jgi:hypothetical protein